RGAVALEYGAQSRRTGFGELAGCGLAKSWRRDDVDDRHVRSGLAAGLLGDRESESSARWSRAQGRQFVDLLDRGAECGHGKAGMGLSGFAARHARLGRHADADLVRRRIQGKAAEAAGTSEPER